MNCSLRSTSSSLNRSARLRLTSADRHCQHGDHRTAKKNQGDDYRDSTQPTRIERATDSTEKQDRSEKHRQQYVVIRDFAGLLCGRLQLIELLVFALNRLQIGLDVIRHRVRAWRRIRIVQRIGL